MAMHCGLEGLFTNHLFMSPGVLCDVLAAEGHWSNLRHILALKGFTIEPCIQEYV